MNTRSCGSNWHAQGMAIALMWLNSGILGPGGDKTKRDVDDRPGVLFSY